MDARTSNHLWLQRHPFIVVLLDQIRLLLFETHRDDPLLDRVDSELRWTFGLRIISGFSVIRSSLFCWIRSVCFSLRRIVMTLSLIG